MFPLKNQTSDGNNNNDKEVNIEADKPQNGLELTV